MSAQYEFEEWYGSRKTQYLYRAPDGGWNVTDNEDCFGEVEETMIDQMNASEVRDPPSSHQTLTLATLPHSHALTALLFVSLSSLCSSAIGRA